jgi:hypothetical protein
MSLSQAFKDSFSDIRGLQLNAEIDYVLLTLKIDAVMPILLYQRPINLHSFSYEYHVCSSDKNRLTTQRSATQLVCGEMRD